jgi:phosphotriesterase-related protein
MIEAALSMEMLARLRYEPLLCKDNCVLDDVDLATVEVERYRTAGGRTIVDQTPIGTGRDVAGLRTVAERTGLTIIASAGYYIERLHPAHLRPLGVDDIAASLIAEVVTGTDGVRSGVLGEMGVSADFTSEERRVLQAAGRAHQETGVPISVHLPGWNRYGHEVLDVLEREGVEPSSIVLSHMNPSVADTSYQRSLAQRGAWLSFDMLGIDWYFGHQDTQAPSDAEVARAVADLYIAGFGEQLLISCDTFLKMQLHRFGGFGYDHVPLRFVPRLQRLGLTESDTTVLTVRNPANVFVAARRGSRAGQKAPTARASDV